MTDPSTLSLPEGLDRPSSATLRRRYAILQRTLSALGVAVVLGVLARLITRTPDPELLLQPDFILPAALLLVAAGVVPWLLVRYFRRRAIRRHQREWGGSALF